MNKYPHCTFDAKAQYDFFFVTRRKPNKMHLCVIKEYFLFNSDALLTKRGYKHGKQTKLLEKATQKVKAEVITRRRLKFPGRF